WKVSIDGPDRPKAFITSSDLGSSYTTQYSTAGNRSITFTATKDGCTSAIQTRTVKVSLPALFLEVTLTAAVTLSQGAQQSFAISVKDQSGAVFSGAKVAIVDACGSSTSIMSSNTPVSYA